jgi:hypothetical protein
MSKTYAAVRQMVGPDKILGVSVKTPTEAAEAQVRKGFVMYTRQWAHHGFQVELTQLLAQPADVVRHEPASRVV